MDKPPPGARELTLEQVAAGAGVSAATVRRWVKRGLVPGFDGRWTPAVAAYVRVIERLRARGHSLDEIKRAGLRVYQGLRNFVAQGLFAVEEVGYSKTIAVQ